MTLFQELPGVLQPHIPDVERRGLARDLFDVPLECTRRRRIESVGAARFRYATGRLRAG